MHASKNGASTVKLGYNEMGEFSEKLVMNRTSLCAGLVQKFEKQTYKLKKRGTDGGANPKHLFSGKKLHY